MSGRVRRFLSELRRRKVWHVAVAYAAAAFVVWQVADIAFPPLGLTERAVGAVLVVTLLGFPIALVLAWAYEIRPEEPAPTALPGADDEGVDRGPAPAQARVGETTGSADWAVAILPFENMSAEEESGYLADGIAEEITNVLAGLPQLRVAARTSAFAFKGRPTDIRDIARRLDVAYLVEGSVRRGGDRLRITAQLVDCASGYHLWSERFDRTMGDIFEIQDEIAAAVAGRLSAETGRGADVRPVVRSDHIDAYEAYLKGRQWMAGFAGEAFVAAQSRFEECLTLDPDFAACRAGLAEALTLQSIGFQIRPERETMPRAREEAERALALDPELPEAHLARALVAMFYEWDHPAAKRSFDVAARLGPNVARVHMWREFYATYVEHDHDAALESNRKAQELNPLDPAPRSREATVRYLFGDLEGAERLFRAMLGQADEVSVLHAGLADTLVRMGRTGEAVREMERAVEVGGPLVAWLGMLAGFHGVNGTVREGRAVLDALERRASEGYVSSFWLAVALAGLGEMDAAFASLESAIGDRDSNLLYAFFVPRRMGLQADPRFPTVLRSVRLSHLVSLL